MKTLLIIAFFFLLFCSCKSQTKEEFKMKISLKFYPTGVLEDTRYSIFISGDSIMFYNHSPRNINDSTNFKVKLTEKQYSTLDSLVSMVKERIINKQSSILDTWGATLDINDIVVYEDDDFSFDSPPKEISNIIKYLFQIIPFKIDLYGFS